ncbi:uncharacterized protein LOC100992754 isoform X2 [Pan paniscus]|uniref:uncharacterized protein LOC100992754 isoform X2 n=1 Tax=Pan paniscus TaxID=9597 RepID=UPI0004F0B785
MLRSWEGNISQAWEVAPGEATVQPPEEGDPHSHPRDPCGSLKAQTPKPVCRESPNLRRRTTTLTQSMIKGETQRSWNASTSPGTATAGITPWGSRPVRLNSRHRRTRLGGGAPCGSSWSKCIGRGPSGCGPSGPGTPRTSWNYCVPLVLRIPCLRSSARLSQPPLVIAGSSKG